MGIVGIRDLTKDDFAAWLPLWRSYNAFYGRVGTTALPDETTRVTWSRFFDAYEPVYALVAELDGQVVGLTHYMFHRSTTMVPPLCYLQDLFTAEHVRGKGVGRALIEAVYRRASTSGSTRVYWQTHEANTVARALYDKLSHHSGFIIYRTEL